MHKGARLFTLGFLTLFLELVLIRYLTGNIWNLGYFPNLVLLAVFTGMGLGFCLHHKIAPDKTPRWFRLFPVALLVLIAFATFGHPTLPGFDGWKGEFGNELFFTARKSNPLSVGILMFVFWFAATCLIFALISQYTAKLFAQFSPLKAYTLDIAGSCAGIVCFIAISFFQIPAFVWMLALIPMFLYAAEERSVLKAALPVVSLVLCAVLAYAQDLKMFSQNKEILTQIESYWSPYQKVKYLKSNRDQYQILANGIPHQEMFTLDQIKKKFYQVPYDFRRNQRLPEYKKVLILGSGSGNDVAAALANNVERVDAVEIDPVLQKIGREHHPANPYQDPRVHVTIDDGRAFMARTKERYDLVIFALTDSVVKVSSLGQLRLENYLFTEEAVRRTSNLLSDDGDIIFYNSYRRPWLTEKLENLLQSGTGYYPARLWQDGDFVILAAGKHNHAAPPSFISQYEIPKDDWPFLYLMHRAIPGLYIGAMVGFSALLVLFLVLLSRQSAGTAAGKVSAATKWAFVFMGIAFLLLETKSVIQFSLLFGTTWLNNSLVFLGVLLLVLAANWAALSVKKENLGIVYALLIASTLLPFAIPLSSLLSVESMFLRFLLASLLTFSPIFFANLVFSVNFRDVAVPEHVFGWNLFGAALGGFVEYLSLATGYQFLAAVVAVSYLLVFFCLRYDAVQMRLGIAGLRQQEG